MRSLVRLPKLGLAVATVLAAGLFVHAAAWADDEPQPTSQQVQTYTNQALPVQRPPGVPWNTPLQAGQMTLQDVLEAHPTPPPSQVSATAPMLAPSSGASAESVMLMQGMQSALQEGGNAGPVKLKPPQMQSGITPALQPAPTSAMAVASPQLQPPVATQTQPAAQAAAQTQTQAPAAPAANVQYQPGQAPKNLAAGTAQENGTAVMMPTATPPSSAPEETAEAPKATDIEQPPVPLDQAASSSAAASSENSTASSGPTAPSQAEGTETGGANVAAEMRREGMKESSPRNPLASAPAQVAAAAPAPETTASAQPAPAASTETASASTATSACAPHVESWTKTCAEAGYPDSYVGKITGETRTICPAGDLQDVWLENSCTPPPESASAAPAAAPPPAPAAQPAAGETKTAEAETAPESISEPASPEASPPASMPAATAAPEEAAPAAAQEPVAAAPAPEIKVASAIVDANCGAASGLAASSKPATDLCAVGTATDVTGDGPWRWDCQGENGGISVSCAAPVATAPAAAAGVPQINVPAMPQASAAPEDGKCGMANGTGLDQAPVADLCMKGVASRVNGGGPWTWACSGENGGKAVACTAPKKIDGVCGAANGADAGAIPTSGLCAAGYASAVTGGGPWNWTCSGLYGGAAATCSAEPKKDAVCGSASLNGRREAPTDDLCNIGKPSDVSGNGPWSWTCAGVNSGASVSCQAPASVDGACGSANGVAASATPSDNLCAAGKASRVTGEGPWDWTCSGEQGGNTQSCTASAAKKEAPVATVACGAAAEAAAMQAPVKNLCSGGTPSAVSGTGPWNWSCSDDAGHSATCSTLASTAGLCGTAANVASAAKPADNLCAAGSPGKVSSVKGSWTWNCDGALGGPSVSCAAPRMKETAEAPAATATAEAAGGAACGAASGQGSLAAPSKDLCTEGKATIVRGRGPWHWLCIKDKTRASCEAPKQIDARCGSENGSTQRTEPSRGLCAAGTPTGVSGTGPWVWTCVGAGGGVSVSCSAASQAQTRIDGTCGAAANTPATMAPASNLCDGGSPSNVYGDGPWTWTCSGVNGGIASSCAASRVALPAPAPPGPAVNGLCGGANGVAGVTQPMEGLCSSGAATAVSGEGPWNWDCLGQNGGMTVSCTAPLQPPAPVTGACGVASGLPTLTIPKSGLCSAGISSAVSGGGPWTWSCSGTNGGGAVGCVAPLATSGGGPLPSVTSAPSSSANEAPAPRAAPTTAVSSGLVTPKLPSGPLPPLDSGNMPPSKPFPSVPRGSAAPPAAADIMSPPLTAPQAAPELPPDEAPLTPPPVRDTIKPSPALMPPSVNSEGKPIPGNRFVLADEVSTVSFAHGSGNIGNDEVPVLDKLAAVLLTHGNVRVTLTAYAGLDSSTSPRDARRLSLERALAIRDYLTAKGISSGRIDVRALGANVPSGDSDRVDVRAN